MFQMKRPPRHCKTFSTSHNLPSRNLELIPSVFTSAVCVLREITQAPVIWSHSASRHFNNISRNVPDYILKHIGSGKHQVDGVVMVNIYPAFMLPKDQQDKANVSTVADHVEYMAGLIGKKQ